jgi:diacylglycerol kinase family enzyme
VKTSGQDIVLLCNPLAGGRWRVLADVLDSDEAKATHRIVTDDIEDVREAIAGLGQRVRLLCIYGGDGTIYRVINELLRDRPAKLPHIALLGGGTMNVTAACLGMRRSPGENFRQVIRAYLADRLLWREVPILAVTQREQVRYGFTFGVGPLVRLLERFEKGQKSRLKALEIALKSTIGVLSGVPRSYQSTLRELEAQLTVDGHHQAHDHWAAVFANTTGAINPFVEPFTAERTRDTLHFLAYAVSSREFAIMAPLLARGLLPIDPRALLHPVSTWRKALLSLLGKDGLPTDPRYVNQTIHHLVLDTAEPHYTLDGEVLTSLDQRFEVQLGPKLQLATLRASRPRLSDGHLAR